MSPAVRRENLRNGACLRPDTLVEAPLVAALAQLVEHIIRNDGVACSSHASGTTCPPSPASARRCRGPAITAGKGVADCTSRAPAGFHPPEISCGKHARRLRTPGGPTTPQARTTAVLQSLPDKYRCRDTLFLLLMISQSEQEKT